MEAQQQLIMFSLELDDSHELPFLDLLIHMVKTAHYCNIVLVLYRGYGRVESEEGTDFDTQQKIPQDG